MVLYLNSLILIWNSISHTEDGQTQSLSCLGRLRFQQFDMEKVLANSTHLMASEGREYDFEEDSTLGKFNFQEMHYINCQYKLCITT